MMKIDIFARIYSIILYLYPQDFRKEYADEMLDVFKDCMRDKEKGEKGFALFLLRDLLSIISMAAIVRIRRFSQIMERGILIKRKEIDPKITGALIVGLGLGLAQVIYFILRMADSDIINLFTYFFIGGFIALTIPEAITLSIGTFVCYRKKAVFSKIIIASILVGIGYFVGTVIFFKCIPIINDNFTYIRRVIVLGPNSLQQNIVNIDKAIWILIKFLGSLFTGVMVGLLLEVVIYRRKFGLVRPVIIGLSVALADLIGYAAYLFSLVLMDMPIRGAHSLPEYLYVLTISSLVKGLLIGYILGYLGRGGLEEGASVKTLSAAEDY